MRVSTVCFRVGRHVDCSTWCTRSAQTFQEPEVVQYPVLVFGFTIMLSNVADVFSAVDFLVMATAQFSLKTMHDFKHYN